MYPSGLKRRLVIRRPVITYKGLNAFLLWIILFILVAYNTNNLDYSAYYSNYNNLNWVKGSEYLYFALEFVFKSLDFSFTQFKIVIALLSYILLAKFANTFAKNSPVFYVLYFIYPFFLDSVEIRHFLGLGIWLNGVSCLLESKHFPRIKYIASIILAAGIQSMYLIFFPLVLCFEVRIRERKNIKYLLLTSSLLSILLVFLPSVTLSIISRSFALFSAFLGNDSRNEYYNAVHTNLGFLVFLAESLFSFFIFWMMYNDQIYVGLQKHEDRLFEFSYVVSIFLIILSPLYRINGQFMRITQASVVLFHVTVIMYMRRAQYSPGRYKKLIPFCYFIYILMLFFVSIGYTHFDDIIINIFQNNSLWTT